MAYATRTSVARASRAALALSLAALAPGLGHLSLGRWVKGTILLVANLTALLTAGKLLAGMVPNYATVSTHEAAALLSGEQVLVLTGVTFALIVCIIYSVRDVRRLLREQ